MEKEDTVNGSETAANQQLTFHLDGDGREEEANALNANDSGEPEPSARGKEILKVLEAVERDSAAIADSFSSLFTSLRFTLSQATSTTVDHMNCFSDAAGRLQECGKFYFDFLTHFLKKARKVLDASTKGNRYINSCLRLNEEMKGIEALAIQLKILRRHVDALDSAVTRIVRFP